MLSVYRYGPVTYSCRFIWLLCSTAFLPWLCGCHAPPVVLRMDSPYGKSALLAQAGELWRGGEPACELKPGSRVAILQCSVEFVTMKHVTPGENQPMVGGPIGPAAALVDLSGVFRRRVTYPNNVLLNFPREVLESVVFILEENGLTVADPDAVTGTRGYRHLARSAVEHSLPAYHLNPKGSDVGRVSEFRVHPAWPLRVLHEGSDSLIETAERAVRMELALDATIKIRLRVGIYHGRASIEQGSEIFITTDDSTRRIFADRSLISDRRVARCNDYEFVSGQEYTVDWTSFRRSMRAMLPIYLSGGLPAPDDTMKASNRLDRVQGVREVSLR